MNNAFLVGLCGLLLIGLHGCRPEKEEVTQKQENQRSYSPKTAETGGEDIIFLSDLHAVSCRQDYGSLGNDKSVDGAPIRMGEYVYDKGVGTHANSEIEYEIPPEYHYFKAEVGLDAERTNGSAVFAVYVDDRLAYESPGLAGQGEPVTVEVPLEKGSKMLRLVVNDGGDGIECDHADWAVARFTRPK